MNAKSVKTKIRDYNIREWPSNIYIPDMVRNKA